MTFGQLVVHDMQVQAELERKEFHAVYLDRPFRSQLGPSSFDNIMLRTYGNVFSKRWKAESVVCDERHYDTDVRDKTDVFRSWKFTYSKRYEFSF